MDIAATPLSNTAPQRSIKMLALAALGIVFGDLGTSPLYALQEAFHMTHGVTTTPENIIGIISLFCWSLIIMVSFKYVSVLMRADNHGEGGILALLALLIGGNYSSNNVNHSHIIRWILLAFIGTAMLYGDGVITPAISVLSAIEGLQIATPDFQPYIISITVIILIALFSIQPFGSGKVGVAFGPILAIWFIVIAILGMHAIINNPQIFAALNPLHAITFFAHNGTRGFVALGAVVLCITGCEALYADMGHFGRLPICLAWYGLAFPALTLNYLGQGALLLRDPSVSSHPFYSLVPTWGLYPMVVLSTLATIVAAQALISAVFSLTQQAAQLGFSPRVQVIHTSRATIGQIYLPALNWLLMIATIIIVLFFKSSDNLASAYGLAVSTTMAITTILFAAFARKRWGWSLLTVGIVAGTFMIADTSFVGANMLKIPEGGWLPLLLGSIVFTIMATWFIGNNMLKVEKEKLALPLNDFLNKLLQSPPYRIHGTGVFLTHHTDEISSVLLVQLKHNQVLHEQVVLLTIQTQEKPRVSEADRIHVEPLTSGFTRIDAHYGYMEMPNIPDILKIAASKGLAPYDPMTTTFYLGRQTVIPAVKDAVIKRWLLGLFMFLRKNERSATLYFGIPPDRVVELGIRFEL